MRRMLAAGAAALAVSGPLAADEVISFTLDNGLDVVVIEDPRADIAVNMVWYRVGAADEPPGVSGIAHFLEHLMFKGTETRDAGEFSDIVEREGGRGNAFTSWDYTGYFQRIASDRLDLMMELEADRMENLQFTDDDWLPERDVILEERGQVVESRPDRLFGEQLFATLFQNHPYGIPIIGWREEMRDLTDADAMDFYERHYGPNNAILIVAGNVDPDEVREMADRHYGAVPENPQITERKRPQEPLVLSDRRVTMSDSRVAQPYVMRYYTAPSRGSGDQGEAAALQVLAELLGGSPETSVLGRALQFDERLALQTAAFYRATNVDDGTFGLVVVPADGVELDEAESEMERVVNEFLEDGVDAEQLERVKTRLRADEIYGMDSAQNRARQYGVGLSVGLGVSDVRDWPAALQDVTEDDVMAAARDLFARHHVTGWLMDAEEDRPDAADQVDYGTEDAADHDDVH